MKFETPDGLEFDTDDFGVSPESVSPDVLLAMDSAYQAGLAIRAMLGTSLTPDLISNVNFSGESGDFSVELTVRDPLTPNKPRRHEQ